MFTERVSAEKVSAMRHTLRLPWAGLILALLATLGTPRSQAATSSISLAWDVPASNVDGSPLTDLAGYKLYYGKQSGAYEACVDAGNMTTTTASELDWNTTYFSAVKAYTISGIESDFSEELEWRTPELPSIVLQPQATTVEELRSGAFGVSAVGTGPLSYQWRCNGNPMVLAQDADLLLRVCPQSIDGAGYDVVVTSPYGSVTSQVAVLTVTPSGAAWEDGSFSWFEIDPLSGLVWPAPDAKGYLAPDSSPGSIAITFDTTGGTHVVWARLAVAGGSGGNGSFYVSLDDGPEEVWYVSGAFVTESTGDRVWDVVNTEVYPFTGLAEDAWVLDLSAGTHTVQFRECDPGSSIDLLLITSDLAWTPGTALALADTDGDGMADGWETGCFGGLDTPAGAPDADADGDGASNLAEFIAGSSAVDGLSCAVVGLYAVDSRPRIVFEALEAAGAGYGGLRRYYTLETCTDLRAGLWQAIPGYQAILGRGQTVEFMTDALASPAPCYRTTMWLE